MPTNGSATSRPLRWRGDNLGLGADDVTVHVMDGGTSVDMSLEEVLRRIDEFDLSGCKRILECLPFQFDVGRVGRSAPVDWRHDGPLVLLHHSIGIAEPICVSVRSHIGRCGLDLEETLARIDQFTDDAQHRLLEALARHYDFDPSNQ